MNIGKLSFNEIIKSTLDNVKLMFAAKGMFLVLLSSLILNLVSNFIINMNLDMRWTLVVDTLNVLVCVVGALIIIIGTALLVKSDLGKTKSKVNLTASIKAIFWKTIGVTILYVIAAGLLGLVVYGLGFIVKIPVVGVYLMALLAVPAIVLFAYFTVYAVIVGKLLVIAVVENQKKSVWNIFTGLIVMTKNNANKLMLNAVLSIFPVFFMAVAALIVFVASVILYILFGWNFPGMISILVLGIQSGANTLSLLINLSGSIVLSYITAYFIVLGVTLTYSIYLDADK